MKMKRYLITLTLFMVLMCCVSAISAASDDAINDTLSEMDFSDEAISVSNDENTVTEIDSDDEAISSSNGEQAIGVDESDSALSAKENDELISQNQENDKLSSITIDGITYDRIIENKIIDALEDYDDEEFYLSKNTYINSCTFLRGEDGTNYISPDSELNILIKNSLIECRIFNSEEGTLKIENSTINNLIKNWEGSTLIISDDTQFGENFAINGQGTIIINDTTRLIPYQTSLNGTYIVENKTFINQMKNYGNLTLINPIFKKSLLNYGNSTMVNATFINSAIFNYDGSSLTIRNSLVNYEINNLKGATLTVENSTLDYEIRNNGILIISDDTQFGENFAINGQGTIIINDTTRLIPYQTSLNGTYIFENYTFNKNMENYGNLTLINPKFNAALTNHGRITIINSTFKEKNSSYTIQNQNGAYLEVIDSKYINSTINFNSADKIVNSKFINNTNMNWYMTNGIVEDCTFINNTKDIRVIPAGNNNGPSGGALTIYQGSVKNCTFINNSVININGQASGGASGGAIYSGNVIIDNCTFIENNVVSESVWIPFQGGGAIYATQLNLTNSKFINNYVESPHGTVVSMTDHYVYQICETGMGGAILVGGTSGNSRNVNIINNTFEANKASIDGSAIYIEAANNNTNITIINNNFTSNSEGKDTIFLRKYIEIPALENNHLEYRNPTTNIDKNNYLNTSIGYKTFELTAPEDVYAGDTVTVKLNIELEHPEFYDSDILDNCNYTWYVNGELITNQETEMTAEITGNYITYVTPSISNSRSNVLAIIPTVLTDIIITPENIDTYLFDGTLIISEKSHLIFEGDFKDIGLMQNSKDNVIFDCENATFTNTAVEINANKNVIKNMKINSTDMSEYLISLSGDDNKILNSTLIQYNSNGKTAAIYNDNGNNNLISGNIIDVTGPSLSITWTDGANTANTQGILSVGGANNIIELNTIRVQNSTDSELAEFGTMEGITAPMGENNTITKNNVFTTGGRFNYGINTLTNVINNQITENNITVTGYRYADGIQVGDGAIGNIIANNNINITCINETPVDEAAISYGIVLTSQGGKISNNNTIVENNVVINGIVNYGMEIYTVTNTIISKNNITLNGAKSMGIGYAHAPNSTVSENIIRISDDSTININSVTEEIQPTSVGIRIQQGSDNVAVTDNVIIVNDKAKTDYSVSTVDENTTVTDNILVNSKGYGDETVISTEAATIENNTINTITEACDVIGNVNKTVNLQANVTLEIGDNVNGGMVEFTDAEGNVIAQANVINGVAATTAIFSEEIKTNITATYRPASAGLIPSQDEKTLEITTKKTTSVLTADDEFSMTYKDGSVWTATLTDDEGNPISGTAVKIGILGKVYSRVTDANGAASLPINLAPGVYEINATFEGDDDYESSFVDAAVTVNKATPVLSGEDLIMAYKEGSWTVTLTDANNNAISNAAIKIGIKGKVYTRKTDADGVASLPINLAPGSYAINATYVGNKYYEEAFVDATITVEKASVALTGEDLVMSYKEGSYSVNLVDGQGNALANVVVKFIIGNTNYNIKTDANGVASLAINLKPGSYSISAVVNDARYESETVTSAITVNTDALSIAAEDVNMTYQDGTAYEVQLVDSQGNPIALAGQIIKVTIKDKTYNRKTDDNGIATLPINLNAGTYTITAEYDGNEINNTIVINKL